MKPLKVYMPTCLYEILKAKADKMEMPVSRLICYAVDNEIAEGEEAFSYPCEMPQTVFVEDAYANEAGRVFRHIKQFGAKSIDQLMLERRQIKVPDKGTLMLAIREIMTKTNILEYVEMTWGKFKFPRGYKVLTTKASVDERKQKKITDLKKQIEFLQKGEDTDG